MQASFTATSATSSISPKRPTGLDVPGRAVGPQPSRGGRSFRREVNAETDRFVFAPQVLTGHQSDLSGERETDVLSGGPARGILNRVMRELGPINDAVPAFPLAAAAIAPLRAMAEAAGRGDFSPLWCGQNPTGCREISAARLTEELASLAQSALINTLRRDSCDL